MFNPTLATASNGGTRPALLKCGMNLNPIFRDAKKYGVACVTVKRLTGNRSAEASLLVEFKNGFRSLVNFATYSHALNWTNARVTRGGPNWAGCKIDIL